MKAKQLLALLLALLTVMSVFVSCGSDTKETDADTESNETSAQTPEETEGDTQPDTLPTETETEPAPETEPEVEIGDVNFADVTNPTLTFFVRHGFQNEVYVKEVADEDLNDAIYWRNQAIKDRLGVDIAIVSQACEWNDYPAWNETLRAAVQSATHDFDAAMIYTGTGSSLAIEGCYMDLEELDMISLEKPWWNQNVRKEGTIYGSLYFASGSIAHSQVSTANILWYNKNLYEQYFAAADKKDIYQVVRDGEWTLDYLYDVVSNVWEDNDNNGEISSGDVIGFMSATGGAAGRMDAWLYALGCDLTKIDPELGEPVACFYDEHTVKAYDDLVNFYMDNEGVFTPGISTGDTSFVNGNTMIYQSTLQHGSQYRDCTFSFGVLPMPKYDTDQENYRSVPDITSSMVTILSTVEPERLDMVSATIELMAAESYKTVIPTYVDVVLKSKQANSPEDAEMVQLVLDTMVYSFGWIFCSTHMADMGKAFRVVDGTRDLSSYYQARVGQYEAKIQELIEGFINLP